MKRFPKQRTAVRIVAGELRGRKMECVVTAELRPTPQMVREAFFSILGNAIPQRPFFDLFAGTGALGFEALSRQATHCTFLERDPQQISHLQEYRQRFQMDSRSTIVRSDVYRWVERWQAPPEPVNVYVSPPFVDLQTRFEPLIRLIEQVQQKVAPGSVVTLQAELGFDDAALPGTDWDRRQYGRNVLLIWVKPDPSLAVDTVATETPTAYDG